MFDMKVKTLLAVIEAGSYTKAAQKLNLTQPAVSHQIRLLENEFDIKIFYRSKNKLKLTPQGKILVQYARRAAAVYSNACQAIADSMTASLPRQERPSFPRCWPPSAMRIRIYI